MPKIENFYLEDLKDGKFIHPKVARYKQDGVEREWEILLSKDSVAILIWHKEKRVFILVKQFRPAVYAQNGDGMTIELCAGLVDKNLPIEKIALEEIEEECGFRTDSIEKITSFYTSVGFSGSRQTLYYAEVDESMRVSEGGGIEGEEDIEVLEYSIDDAKSLIKNDNIARTPGLLFALEWWFIKNKIV